MVSVEKRDEAEGTKGSRLGHCTGLLVIDVAANTTSVHAFGPEENSIAWFVAVGLAIMLCVAARSQSLAAPLTAQTGSMPVLTQWCHLLGKIHLLVASGTQVGLSGKGGDAASFGWWLGGKHSLLLSFGCWIHTSGRWVVVGWSIVHVRAGSTDVHTFWPKEGSIARFVAVGPSIVLSVASSVEELVAAVTLETQLVPVLSQRWHLFSEIHRLVTLWALWSHVAVSWVEWKWCVVSL